MKELLRELMKNAEENGYPVWNWNPQDVAQEIQVYVDEFAEVNTDQMIEAIKEIQEETNE